MKKRGTKANLLFLDTCREIKYPTNSRGDSTPSETQNPAMQHDTVYAYATAPGHPASDGDDGHGKDTVEGTTCDYWVIANSCLALRILLPSPDSRLMSSLAHYTCQ